MSCRHVEDAAMALIALLVSLLVMELLDGSPGTIPDGPLPTVIKPV
jgi:hypothetical protein